jgi:mRNA interferase MazF
MDFDPQLGHEQKGRRPALVVSNDIFNKFSNLFIVCPITNTNQQPRSKTARYVGS